MAVPFWMEPDFPEQVAAGQVQVPTITAPPPPHPVFAPPPLYAPPPPPAPPPLPSFVTYRQGVPGPMQVGGMPSTEFMPPPLSYYRQGVPGPMQVGGVPSTQFLPPPRPKPPVPPPPPTPRIPGRVPSLVPPGTARPATELETLIPLGETGLPRGIEEAWLAPKQAIGAYHETEKGKVDVELGAAVLDSVFQVGKLATAPILTPLSVVGAAWQQRSNGWRGMVRSASESALQLFRGPQQDLKESVGQIADILRPAYGQVWRKVVTGEMPPVEVPGARIFTDVEWDEMKRSWDDARSFSYTWLFEPEAERNYQSWKTLEEQRLGRPLTYAEIDEGKKKFENPNTELVGELIFDLTNLVPGKVWDVAFRAAKVPFRAAWELAKIAPGTKQAIEWATRATLQTAGRWQYNKAVHALTRMWEAYPESTLDNLLSDFPMERMAKGDVPATMFRSDYRGLQELNQIIPQLERDEAGNVVNRWAALAEDAAAAAKEGLEARGFVWDNLDEAVKKRVTINHMGLTFQEEYLLKEGVPRKYADGTWKAYRGGQLVKLSPSEAFQVEAGQFGNKLRSLWIETALYARPGFTIINVLDSTARMMLSGSGFARKLDDILMGGTYFPPEILGGFSGASDEALTTFIREKGRIPYPWESIGRAAEGVVAAPSGFANWPAPIGRSGAEKFPIFKYVNAANWMGGWREFNQAVELSVRARAYHDYYWRLFGGLKTQFGDEFILRSALSENAKKVAREMYASAGDNPLRWQKLVQDFIEGKVAWEHVVPPGIAEELATRAIPPGQAADIVRGVTNELLERINKAGRLTPEDARDVMQFWRSQIDEYPANVAREAAASNMSLVPTRAAPDPEALAYAQRGELSKVEEVLAKREAEAEAAKGAGWLTPEEATGIREMQEAGVVKQAPAEYLKAGDEARRAWNEAARQASTSGEASIQTRFASLQQASGEIARFTHRALREVWPGPLLEKSAKARARRWKTTFAIGEKVWWEHANNGMKAGDAMWAGDALPDANPSPVAFLERMGFQFQDWVDNVPGKVLAPVPGRTTPKVLAGDEARKFIAYFVDDLNPDPRQPRRSRWDQPPGATSEAPPTPPEAPTPTPTPETPGVGVGPEEVKPLEVDYSRLTPDAANFLRKIDEGGIPVFETGRLKRMAKENGVDITGLTPEEIANALRLKAQGVEVRPAAPPLEAPAPTPAGVLSDDDLTAAARKMMEDGERVSASIIQRRFKVGFQRAKDAFEAAEAQIRAAAKKPYVKPSLTRKEPPAPVSPAPTPTPSAPTPPEPTPAAPVEVVPPPAPPPAPVEIRDVATVKPEALERANAFNALNIGTFEGAPAWTDGALVLKGKPPINLPINTSRQIAADMAEMVEKAKGITPAMAVEAEVVGVVEDAVIIATPDRSRISLLQDHYYAHLKREYGENLAFRLHERSTEPLDIYRGSERVGMVMPIRLELGERQAILDALPVTLAERPIDVEALEEYIETEEVHYAPELPAIPAPAEPGGVARAAPEGGEAVLRPGGEPLAEVSPADVRGIEEIRETPAGPPVGGEPDVRSNVEPYGEGGDARPGLGVDEGGVALATERGGRAEPGARPLHLDTPARPAGLDYLISASDHLGEGGAKTKFNRNVAAIQTLRQIQKEGRRATLDEQRLLVQYTGWGGLSPAFGWTRDWENERRLLEELQDTGVISEAEYDAMRASTVNAHYTSAEVMRAMWKAVERLGFRGGRVLEPALGIGHFFGLMPSDLAARSTRAGVELDKISGEIARELYQSADISIQGFETTHLPHRFFDLVISNVPFGNYPVFDESFKKGRRFLTTSIHNYYFAKALDLTRPGGLIAFITSHHTLDAVDALRVREYLAEQADFLGAIRLPNTAFKANAGTEVTTDIIFLRRRPKGTEASGETWMGRGEVNEYPVNEYFARHPEMMLGTWSATGTMYRRGEMTLEPFPDRELSDLLAEAVARLPEGMMGQVVVEAVKPEVVREALVAEPSERPFAYVVVEGTVYQNEAGLLQPVDDEPANLERIKGMVSIREAARATLAVQMQASASDALVKEAQAKLNRVYDGFVKKHGPLNSVSNKRAFADDPESAFLLALEDWDRKAKKAAKAPIFRQRVIGKPSEVRRVETARDALMVSLNEKGVIDWDLMAEVKGSPAAALQAELAGTVVFPNPAGGWEEASAYLAGNVKEKLRQAEAAARLDPRFERNVEALRAVQPPDINPADIHVSLGAPWVPPEDVQGFIHHLLHKRIEVRYVEPLAQWVVEKADYYTARSTLNTQTWATNEFTALELVSLALNGKVPTVYSKIETPTGEVRVVQQAATTAAREMQDKINREFATWLWSEAERTESLARRYNDTYNAVVERQYDGAHLTLPGMAADMPPLRPHQKNSIWRGVQGGNLLLSHIVGAGKTWTMAGISMEMRRLGLARKPLHVVKNHMLEQYATDFLRMYPAAKVLTASVEAFGDAATRTRMMSRIATGDWDSVIVTHSAFEKLPVRDETFNTFLREQIRELEDFLYSLKKNDATDRLTVKEIEKAKRRLETKLTERAARSTKDETILFEDLGIDLLFVDEAQAFKNLFFATKRTRVAGLPQTESNRAFDMFIKTRNVQRRQNGRGLVFATGTPISNSIAEMYTLQRYLGEDRLRDLGLAHFDAWANQFAELVTAVEMKPTGGGYRVHTRLAKYNNMPELSSIFREFSDVQMDRQALGLPVPEVERIQVSAPAAPELKEYIDQLVKRAESLSSKDPREDNMLKITNDGRKAALDIRLIDPSLPDHPDSKVNRMVDNLFEIWKATTGVEIEGVEGVHNLTQLVFINQSTPQAGKFNLYDDVRDKLVARGIPKNEIAFIHEANSNAAKQELYDKVNAGEVRVILGSIEKMGMGTNVQTRLVALHEADPPWRPSDVEQGQGRIIRQGNLNPKIKVYTYVTEESFDVFMFQTNERKAGFIGQALKGGGERTVEEVDAVVLNFAQLRALATGNPLVLREIEVSAELSRLRMLAQEHQRRLYSAASDLESLRRKIPSVEATLTTAERALEVYQQEQTARGWQVVIEGTTYTDPEEAGKVMMAMDVAARGTKVTRQVGEVYGFPLWLEGSPDKDRLSSFWIYVDAPRGLLYFQKVSYVKPEMAAKAVVARMGENLPKDIENFRRSVAQFRTDLAQLERGVGPFEHADRLRALSEEHRAIQEQLGMLEAGAPKQVLDAAEDGGGMGGGAPDGEEGENLADAARRAAYLNSRSLRDMLDYWEGYLSEYIPRMEREMATGRPALTPAERAAWEEAGRAGVSSLNGAKEKAMRQAIDQTNRAMINYADSTSLDQVMSFFFPFWKFPSRSLPYWLEQFALHPQLLTATLKEREMSDRYAIQRGAVTRYGKPLPRLRGYLPVGNTDWWVNPLNPFSWRQALPEWERANFYDDGIEEDEPGLKRLFEWILPRQQLLGFNLAPWWEFGIRRLNLVDENKFPRRSLISAFDLIPPWWQRDVMRWARATFWPGAPDTWTPQVGWQDYLVEREVLAKALAAIQASSAEAEKWRLAEAAHLALRNHSGPEWEAALRAVEQEQYGAHAFGFFTGIYPKRFSQEEKNLIQTRNDIGKLRDAIRNETGFNVWQGTRYETPEGRTAGLFGYLNVRDETGQQLYGAERHARLSEILARNEQYTDALREQQGILERREAELRALPIGTPWEVREKIYLKYQAMTDDLEDSLPKWNSSGKPADMLTEHLTDMWMRILLSSRPQFRADAEAYPDYQKRVQEWERTLPQLAYRTLWTTFMNRARQDGSADFLEQNADTFRALTNAEAITAWDLANDDEYDALNRVWKDNYWDSFWQTVGGLRGYEREMAERAFVAQYNGVAPDEQTLVGWVNALYPGRFTNEQLHAAITGAGALSFQERLDYDRTEDEKRADDIWRILSWAGPNKDALKEELGRDQSAWLDFWWKADGSPAAFGSREEFLRFYDAMKDAEGALSLRRPDDRTLAEYAEADALNREFRDWVVERWGEEIYKTQSAYFDLRDKEKFDFRETHPELEEYWDFRDEWSGQNAIWSQYFRPDWTPERNSAYQLHKQFEATVEQQFGPGIYRTQNDYFDLSGSYEKRAYRRAHPELSAYWNFRDQWSAAHPIWVKYYRPDWKPETSTAPAAFYSRVYGGPAQFGFAPP